MMKDNMISMKISSKNKMILITSKRFWQKRRRLPIDWHSSLSREGDHHENEEYETADHEINELKGKGTEIIRYKNVGKTTQLQEERILKVTKKSENQEKSSMDGVYVIFILVEHHLSFFFYFYILEELYLMVHTFIMQILGFLEFFFSSS